MRPLNFARLEARHGGRLGLFARDDAAQVGWRADERFTYASTFKLFLAAATLQRVARGQERLDRPVAITPADLVSHAPVTGAAVGGALTIEQLCQAAVEVSDNPAANILIRELGGLDAWRAWHRSIGDRVTRVDRWETDLNIVGDDLDTTTPEQAVINMERVLEDDVLDAAGRDRLETWLRDSPSGAGRIKAGAPYTWSVAHKTGTSDVLTNDIGVVRPHTGAPIFISVYLELSGAATPVQREAVIADATLVALAALGHG